MGIIFQMNFLFDSVTIFLFISQDVVSTFSELSSPAINNTHLSSTLSDAASQYYTHRLAFLDDILEEYDKRAWPTYGKGMPTEVKVNIHINDLGSVNAANMDYSLDIYLRQLWKDQRLMLSAFGINQIVTLNGDDLIDKIWKPDLFFRNVKEARFHRVTVPNMLIKISPDGSILFSMRLTLKLFCHMSFRHYPLDTQRCHVIVGPYAQTTDQVRVRWQEKNALLIEEMVELNEFDLVDYSCGQFLRVIDTGAFSFLNVSFVLERQYGYHLIQTYLPTFLIVMISWVSFWLNVDAVPARVTLGVTTLLTLTTVASGVRTQLPPVSYIKAIDIWIGSCSVMVFGALLEFTLVNYLSRSEKTSEILKKPMSTFKHPRTSVINPKPSQEDETKSIKNTSNLKEAIIVDRVCRVLFPLVFFVFNLVYWFYYLYTPEL
ncbi:glycine receptor subunit alpha-2-like [Tachypleus tridentatus]|uniref:glycine receptor subunit alpha-2-like n=1 Tax=Tachypleus tridentatus TaxID=6853 RepID=UPI003FD20DB0